MTDNKMSLGAAAITAGVAYLMMMGTPFAEFYVLEKLIVQGDMAKTANNIMAHEALFRYGMVGYLVNFVGDLIASWALFILLKPVNENLSILTALFRLVYTVISLAAILNLVTVLTLLNTAAYGAVFTPQQIYAQVDLSFMAFRKGWSVAYLFFGIHLWLLGYLIIKSKYIPGIIGWLLIVAGSGWLIDNLKPLLFPDFTINFIFIMITGLGELVFTLWLWIRGWKIPEPKF
jgi:hypothetical protein